MVIRDKMQQCDLCGCEKLDAVYVPENSRRNLTVYVCSCCGLVQSLPRIDYIEDHTPSTSCDATFGNLRYGKQFSAEYFESSLKKYIGKIPDHSRILDIGAGRGWGAKVIIDTLKNVSEVWCVEPDKKLLKPNLDVRWITERIENVVLPFDYFDFVVALHTLEHVKSAKLMARIMYDALTPGGKLYVSVPNLEYIDKTLPISEFFIDKHLYYFTSTTLEGVLRSVGFEIYETVLHKDEIVVFACKPRASDTYSYLKSKELICDYSNKRKEAANLIRHNVAVLNAAMNAGKKVCAWGAGRIFDAYRKAGLYVDKLSGIVDLYLPEFDLPLIRDVNSLPVCDVVVIMSTDYKDDIMKVLQEKYKNKIFLCDEHIDKV